jgi:hypothetical protein
VGTTRRARRDQIPTCSRYFFAYTPAGTACGSANASRSKLAISDGATSRRGVRAGTTTTSVFERRSTRSVARTAPARVTTSIWASSAEKKTSAGAPARIWRARSLDAPKLKTT